MADEVKGILALAVGPELSRDIGRDATESDDVRPYVHGLRSGFFGRGAAGDPDIVIRYRQTAVQNLQATVQRELDRASLIFPMSTSALKAAICVTSTVPIVFPSCSDPVADGVVDSFARPGRNATGLSALRSQTADDCVEFFKLTVPSLKEIYALHKPNYQPAVRPIAKCQLVARELGMTFHPRAVQTPEEIDTVLGTITQHGSEGAPERGVMLLPDDFCFSQSPKIIDATLRRRLPLFHALPDWVRESARSALAAYGMSQRNCGDAVADYVRMILRGAASPNLLPVKRGGIFEFKVSHAVADELDIAIPSFVDQMRDP
jgi:ABC-type uncharacterized transport system substrate-binding protein